jgi:hypothetical protein
MSNGMLRSFLSEKFIVITGCVVKCSIVVQGLVKILSIALMSVRIVLGVFLIKVFNPT